MALFLAGLAVKERDNAFCVSCHLHDEKYIRYNAATPVDLAGAHRQADARVGCIACHGGSDMPRRLRIWGGAAFDTMRFLAGAYAEPDRMRLPLRDAECRQCHTPIDKRRGQPASVAFSAGPASPGPAGEETILETQPPPAAESITFHGLREHETLSVTCARCHASHATGGQSSAGYLVPTIMNPVCRECHPSM